MSSLKKTKKKPGTSRKPPRGSSKGFKGIEKGIPVKTSKNTLTFAQFHEHKTAEKERKFKLRRPSISPLLEIDFKNFKEMETARLVDLTPRKSSVQNLSGAADFMSPNTVYTFMLKGFSTLTSNASGVTALYIAFDPSSSGYNFAEWTTLSSLFTEFRLRDVFIQCVSPQAITNTTEATPIAIGSNLGLTVSTGTPSGFGQVLQQADGRFWSALHDTSPTGYHLRVNANTVGWALCSAPTVTPYAGAPGVIQFYGSSQGVSNTQVAQVAVNITYQFRVRS